MPVVFEELEPDGAPDPDARRTPTMRQAAVVLVVVALVVVVLVRRDPTDETAARSAPSPAPSATGTRFTSMPAPPPSPASETSSAPSVAGGPLPAGSVTLQPESTPIVMAVYALPGTMTVMGRQGWRPESTDDADVRRYTAVDIASGALRPTVTFGVADRSPASSDIVVTTDGYASRLAAQGTSSVSVVLSAFGDTMAGDLTYTDAVGRCVKERVWNHGGVTLFVRIADDADHAADVEALFSESVRYGITTS